MVFMRAETGEHYTVVWPHGFSARLLDDRAELVYPDGSVLARERDVISNLAAGEAENGDTLACFDLAAKPVVDRAP